MYQSIFENQIKDSQILFYDEASLFVMERFPQGAASFIANSNLKSAFSIHSLLNENNKNESILNLIQNQSIICFLIDLNIDQQLKDVLKEFENRCENLKIVGRNSLLGFIIF